MTALLQLRNLTHFYGDVCALDGIDLSLEQGVVGLVGQNGAGKSTMMQILLGLIQPTHGFATVLGHEVRWAGVKLRGRVGYMPERDSIVRGLNGMEYVALAGELSGMARRQALRRSHETLSYLQMEDARYRKLDQYSVGMIQKIKLAATLVHDPDLLLLDEPTSGLDPDGRAAMLALIGALAARPGKSLMLSSHLLGDIEQVCSSAVILNQGRIVAAGPLDELRSKRQRCYHLQWDGDGRQYLESLCRLGVAVKVNEKQAHLAMAFVPQDWTTNTFFVEAGKHSVLLKGVKPEEEDLEAVYHRVIGSATGTTLEAESSEPIEDMR